VKTYRGYTDTDETVGGPNGPALVYEEGRAPYPLRHLIVHSPSGMAWGYGGSGAADLALAVLADHLGEAEAIPAHDRYDHAIAERIQDTRAWALHQDFKRHFIAPLDQGSGWTITGAEVAAWLVPRLPEIECAHQERRATALIGRRVRLDDGRTGDVMDVEGEGDELRLVLIVPGYDAWQRVEPARVVQDLGQMPDEEDEEDETA